MKCGECEADIEGPYHRVCHELWHTRRMQEKRREQEAVKMEILYEGRHYRGLLYLVEEEKK